MYKQSQLQHHATNLTPLSVLLPELFFPFVFDFALVTVFLEGPAWSVESPASSSARFRVVFLAVVGFLELSSGPSHSSNVAPLMGISSMNIHIDFITRSFVRISLCIFLTCLLNAQIWSARSIHEHFCILASKTPAHMDEILVRELVNLKKSTDHNEFYRGETFFDFRETSLIFLCYGYFNERELGRYHV